MSIYLQEETKSCYKKANKRPLAEKQDGGSEDTVRHTNLALATGQDVTVVATYGAYTIKQC